MGFATDLIAPLAQRMIKTVLGQHAEVYHHMPYTEYMNKMQECDMFITPFPYGNMNGIADAVACGLAGVCKSGPQVHEHIDVGLFQRLEMPDWTIAPTVEGYIEAIVRMVDGHKERNALRKSLLKSNALEKLYTGRPEILGQRLLQILNDTQVGKKA
jgi:predicted O-linked N-acetylglucosamine transferase (SPINDLY family)